MARRVDVEDEWDGEEDDHAGEDTFPCPYCNKPIHDEAVRCPYCENYLSAEDAPPSRKPWWILLGVGLCLWVVYRWIMGPR